MSDVAFGWDLGLSVGLRFEIDAPLISAALSLFWGAGYSPSAVFLELYVFHGRDILSSWATRVISSFAGNALCCLPLSSLEVLVLLSGLLSFCCCAVLVVPSETGVLSRRGQSLKTRSRAGALHVAI